MRKDYDFSKAKRGSVAKAKGKSRITFYIDDDILEAYRQKGDELGREYQTLINEALRESLVKKAVAVDARTMRRIVREALSARHSRIAPTIILGHARRGDALPIVLFLLNFFVSLSDPGGTIRKR